jgi:hypothetical protein
MTTVEDFALIISIVISVRVLHSTGEIEKITTISGATLTDFGDLYEPSSDDAKWQLVVHFSAKKADKRRLRSEFDSDSEDEDISKPEEKKKAYRCSRCGETYPESRAEGCAWHKGVYAVKFTDSIVEVPHNDPSEFDPSFNAEEHLTKPDIREWSCCGEKLQYGPGCTSGDHQRDKHSDETLDQKLVTLFTGSHPLEPLALAPMSNTNGQAVPVPIPNAAGANMDDDDVQFIPRANILGNADPQAVVSLNNVLLAKKCFCLNENPNHTLESILVPNGGVTYLQSDCDAELLITVGFSTLVRMNAIRFTVPNVSQAPACIKIYANKSTSINFDNVATMKPDQTAELKLESFMDGTASVQLQAFKFTKVDTLTLYISSNIDDMDTTCISRLVFVGAAPFVR